MSQASISPYMIAGNLPFGGGGAGMVAAAGGGPLGQQYADAYSTALQQNQANYQNILKGYQQTQANQLTQQQAIGAGYNQLAGQIGQQGSAALNSMWGGQNQINQGYNQLQGRVSGLINNVGASQLQAIQDAYKQQSGGLTQQLLNSGLGNTTVMGQMQRGPMLDAEKAKVALANQMAQLQAGYASQLGQSQLNFQDQALMAEMAQRNQTTGLQAQYGAQGLQYGNLANQQATEQANRQLGFMGSVTSQYPDASQYANILAQQGMTGQANADRALLAEQMRQQQGMGGLGMAMGMGGGGGFNTRSSGMFTGDLGRQYIPPQPQMPGPISFGAGGGMNPITAPPGMAYSYGGGLIGATIGLGQGSPADWASWAAQGAGAGPVGGGIMGGMNRLIEGGGDWATRSNVSGMGTPYSQTMLPSGNWGPPEYGD